MTKPKKQSNLKAILITSLIFSIVIAGLIWAYHWQIEYYKKCQEFTDYKELNTKIDRIINDYHCTDSEKKQYKSAIMRAKHPLKTALIIKIESEGRPLAKSRNPKTGAIIAYGPMQLTADKFKPGQNRHDIALNVALGARYFEAQLDRFGSVELALIAYNAGPGTVERYGNNPPYAEAIGYKAKYKRLKGVYGC